MNPILVVMFYIDIIQSMKFSVHLKKMFLSFIKKLLFFYCILIQNAVLYFEGFKPNMGSRHIYRGA